MARHCEPRAVRTDAFAAYVERVVAEAPPLTESQRADLRQLLRPVVIARRQMAGAS